MRTSPPRRAARRPTGLGPRSPGRDGTWPVAPRSGWTLRNPQKELLARASEAHLRRRSGDPTIVHGLEPDPFAYEYEDGDILHGVGPPGKMRHGGVYRGSILRVR
jgi:hypothetical protein